MAETAARAESRRLPPGSHGIPADVVARNQRERLIAAMAEVCAERGYAETSVERVAKRAGVSSVTFYKQFAGKSECLLASHRALLGRLLEAIDQGQEALPTALSVLAADAPSARLLTIEILAAGPEGGRRHDAMVAALAERWGSGWVLAAGIVALIGKLVMAGEADCLPELEDELRVLISGR